MTRRLFPFVLTGTLALAVANCQGGDDDSTSGRKGGSGGAGGGAGRGAGGAGRAAGGTAGASGATGGAAGTAGTGGAAGNGAASTAGRASGAGAGSGGASGAGAAGRGPGGFSGTTSGGESGSGPEAGGDGGTGNASGSTYDEVVLGDSPVMYLAMSALSGTEPDLTGNGHDGTYHGGTTQSATLPNGELAADFAGDPQYVSVPSHAALSIPTTKNLTWEAWIRPSVLQFADNSNGYVDWMGKCEEYAPTCEWEARMYNMTNSSNRCNRLSAYAFNPGADLGSGAFWEATTCGTIQANSWYHVVGEYTTAQTPSACDDEFPGSIDIWVNGVKWNQSTHGETGCMSQYEVAPEANDSPLNIGTMAQDGWFEGAIAKVAIYDVRLTNEQIGNHYRAMTGNVPTGSCASTCSF